jgi:hypothetical protein
MHLAHIQRIQPIAEFRFLPLDVGHDPCTLELVLGF